MVEELEFLDRGHARLIQGCQEGINESIDLHAAFDIAKFRAAAGDGCIDRRHVP